MALRKFFVVLDCENDAQHEEVQKIFNELSNTRALAADTIQRAYPMYKAREVEIKQLFSLLRENGVKGLISVQGATLLARLARK